MQLRTDHQQLLMTGRLHQSYQPQSPSPASPAVNHQQRCQPSSTVIATRMSMFGAVIVSYKNSLWPVPSNLLTYLVFRGLFCDWSPVIVVGEKMAR